MTAKEMINNEVVRKLLLDAIKKARNYTRELLAFGTRDEVIIAVQLMRQEQSKQRSAKLTTTQAVLNAYHVAHYHKMPDHDVRVVYKTYPTCHASLRSGKSSHTLVVKRSWFRDVRNHGLQTWQGCLVLGATVEGYLDDGNKVYQIIYAKHGKGINIFPCSARVVRELATFVKYEGMALTRPDLVRIYAPKVKLPADTDIPFLILADMVEEQLGLPQVAQALRGK